MNVEEGDALTELSAEQRQAKLPKSERKDHSPVKANFGFDHGSPPVSSPIVRLWNHTRAKQEKLEKLRADTIAHMKEKQVRAAENKLHGNQTIRRERSAMWGSIVAACCFTVELRRCIVSIQKMSHLRALFRPILKRLQKRARIRLTLRKCANLRLMQKPTVADVLITNTWLSGMPESTISLLVEAAEPSVYFERESVIYEGERQSDVYILEDGSLELIRTVNKERRTMHNVGKWSVIGLVNLMSGEPHITAVRCTTDCRLWRIHEGVARDILAKSMAYSVHHNALTTAVNAQSFYLYNAYKLEPRTLRACSSLFAAWGPGLLQDLCDTAVIRSNIKNHVVFNVKEFGKMGILITGRAKMSIHCLDGTLESVRYLQPGDSFGDTWLFNTPFRSVKNVTITAECLVEYYVITCTSISRILCGHVDVNGAVNRAVDGLIIQLVGGPTEENLEKCGISVHTSQKNIKALIKRFTPVVYHKKTTVFDAGAPVENAAFVAFGQVRRRTRDGPEEVITGGGFIGIEEAYVEGQCATWPYTVLAGQATVLYKVPWQVIVQLFPKEQTKPEEAKGKQRVQYSVDEILKGRERCTERLRDTRKKEMQAVVELNREAAEKAAQVKLREEQEQKLIQEQLLREREAARIYILNNTNQKDSLVSAARKTFYNETKKTDFQPLWHRPPPLPDAAAKEAVAKEGAQTFDAYPSASKSLPNPPSVVPVSFVFSAAPFPEFFPPAVKKASLSHDVISDGDLRRRSNAHHVPCPPPDMETYRRSMLLKEMPPKPLGPYPPPVKKGSLASDKKFSKTAVTVLGQQIEKHNDARHMRRYKEVLHPPRPLKKVPEYIMKQSNEMKKRTSL